MHKHENWHKELITPHQNYHVIKFYDGTKGVFKKVRLFNMKKV